MALTKARFQNLASRLIDDKFADFRRSLSFSITTGGTYNPVTGVVTGGTTTVYSYQAIPSVMDIEEWQGFDIAVTDAPVTYARIDSFKPSVEQTCTFDGAAYQVRAARYDAADAAVKLVLRKL